MKKRAEKPQALCDQKATVGTPSFLAVFCVKESAPSKIIQVRGGTKVNEVVQMQRVVISQGST